MNRLPNIFLALLVAISFAGCRKDVKKQLQRKAGFEIGMNVGNTPIGVNDTADLNQDYNLYVSLFQLYLSKITLIDVEGNEALLKDVVLINPGSAGNSHFTLNLPEGDFNRLRMGLGVDPVTNNSDPNSFANDHPLAAYQGMYWSMLKYRFAVFEGRAIDKNSGSSALIAYHTGTDPLYKVVDFPVDISSSKLGYELSLSIDLSILFDGPGGKIDFPTQSSTHTVVSDPHDYQIAEIFMENLQAAIDLQTISPQE